MMLRKTLFHRQTATGTLIVSHLAKFHLRDGIGTGQGTQG